MTKGVIVLKPWFLDVTIHPDAGEEENNKT
jgi:hypothetical protein